MHLHVMDVVLTGRHTQIDLAEFSAGCLPDTIRIVGVCPARPAVTGGDVCGNVAHVYKADDHECAAAILLCGTPR